LQELRGEALFDAGSPEFHAELMAATGKLAVPFLPYPDWAIIAQMLATFFS